MVSVLGGATKVIVVVSFTYQTDLVYIPDLTKYSPKKLQKLFDKWLYNKNINHEYWIYTEGKKDYVSYDISAFIKWLNENIFVGSDEKAKIVEENISNIPLEAERLYF